MREYKFRGKRVDNGEWVYGNYFIDERDIEDGFIWRDIPQIQQRYGDHYQYYDVDPSTVGQYIERKDKHKEEIYEGDIVLYDRNIHEDIDKQKFEVIWMQDGYCLRELQHKYILDGIWWEMTEKIGNIHDNPELRKEVE